MREDLNYLGQLFQVGASQTNFLNAIGGTNGANTCKSFLFPVSQPYSLASASQPAITEASSVTGQTPTTYTTSQAYNTVQIFQQAFEVSYAKQSAVGEIGGISISGETPIQNPMDFQKMLALKQMAIDLEFSFLQGAYQAGSNASTAAKTRGLKNAISTNTVAASSALLTKTMIDTLLRAMVGSGTPFLNPTIVVNAYQKQVLSSIYGYAPTSKVEGGLNIQKITTDFAEINVLWTPNMPTDELYITELSVIKPMILPVDGNLIVVEDKVKAGASKGGQIYAQIGLDYGAEQYHGSITGLKYQ